ncbi:MULTISPECIES: ABC transporter permease [unclassified Flavobacterium]|uniref:ABC transporter permease n=1 Tax=unclassified Flavobacterium TaxID=196869 RepID=UPI001F12DB11|nr:MULTISPECIES: FtsX-like permease family protein [unclassified Flavobacterium]UMY66223.1 ABC transporter permease [Flavobacterium sp. HJ-32-4]
MNFPLYIAKRYLRSASKNNAINIINRIAAIGVVAGAMALFVVMSVFSGLVDFSLSFSNTSDPDLKATARIGKTFTVTPAQERALRQVKGIAQVSKTVEERVLFSFKGKEMVAYLKGTDTLYNKVSTVEKSLQDGQWWTPETIECVVGYGILDRLSIGLVDANNLLEVYVPRPGTGTIDSPDEALTRAKLVPVGFFALSEDLDSQYVFADIRLVQAILAYPPTRISSLEIALAPGADEAAVRKGITTIVGPSLTIKNRAELNASLYRMLNTENLVLYLIFTLVIIIALFNLVGALTMMIIEKQSNLRTLFSLGSTLPELRRIFFLQGTLLTVFGGLLGIALGALLVFVQQQFELVMITMTQPYPVKFEMVNVLIVFATIGTLGTLASFIASRRISAALLRQ